MRFIWILVAFVAIVLLGGPKAQAATTERDSAHDRTVKLNDWSRSVASGTNVTVPPPREVRLIRLVKPKKSRREISLAPTSFRWLKPTDEVGAAQAILRKLRRARARSRRRSRAPGSGPGTDAVPPPTRRASGGSE